MSKEIYRQAAAVILLIAMILTISGCGEKPTENPEQLQIETAQPEAEHTVTAPSEPVQETVNTPSPEREPAAQEPQAPTPERKPEPPAEFEMPPEKDPEPPVQQSEEPADQPAEPEEPAEPAFDVAAVRAGLYNAKTLECLFAKAETEPLYPASMTKLVTACTALRYMDDMQEVIRVGTEMQFVKEGSSICWIREGHKLKMQDLVTGLLIASGNDAAYTIAVNVARRASGNENLTDQEAVDYFCELMNQFAWDVGARNSNFVNPDGWDDEEQYTTVNDLAIIASCALKYPLIRDIVCQQSKFVRFVSGQTITWTNTNYLLDPSSKYYCPYAIGMKTGSTSLAGKCLIAAVQIDGEEYISVVSGCEKEKDRYQSSLDLFGLVLPEAEASAESNAA